jgi:membrane protein YdbS with pleckstrin-like domain
VQYVGFAGRSMLAGFAFCVVWTVLAFLAVAPWLDRYVLVVSNPEAEAGETANGPQPTRPPERLGWLVAVGLSGAAWAFQLFRWAYRKLAYQFRLTTHRLFLHRGFLYELQVIPLRQLVRAEVRQRPLERRLGIGRIYLFGDASPHALAVLVGVAAPEPLAAAIRQQVERLRRPARVEV